MKLTEMLSPLPFCHNQSDPLFSLYTLKYVTVSLSCSSALTMSELRSNLGVTREQIVIEVVNTEEMDLGRQYGIKREGA